MTHKIAYRSALTSAVLLAATVGIAGCGSSEAAGSGINKGDNLAEQPGDDAGPAGPVFNTGGSTGSGGGPPMGEECVGVGAAAEALPVDMYIMFDKSTSMLDPLPGATESKWDGAVRAVNSFVQNPAATGIGVGIQFFALAGNDVCNETAYATPAVDIGQLPSVSGDIVNAVNAQSPQTLTPTYPALQGALMKMKAWAQTNPERAPIVVLVTDGYPTQCDENDDPMKGASITAIADLAREAAESDPRVLTFVVGIDGVANLATIARAGGTGEPFLIDSGDIEQQFVEAMLSIASTPLSCNFEVPKENPENPEEMVDIEEVSVVYDSAATGESISIPRLNNLGDCSLTTGEGWYYDHPTQPTEIRICPHTCKLFAAGSVSIRLGCKPPPPDVM